MIDYKSIWDSINSESKNHHLQPQIARRVPSTGLFNAFLATDFKKGIRLLYIKLESDKDIVIETLPRFRGLDISWTVQSIGEFSQALFLRFAQSIPNTDNIFELFVSDLCDKIVRLQVKRNFSSTLTRTLAEWKVFFEKQENEILSISAQKGLIGELYFLKDYLFQKYPFAESLFFWTGSDRTNHDFQILNTAVEIKTTSGKQHKKFTISSERQLDSTGLEHLYLSLFSLNLHINMPDRTLPALISDIYSEIQNDSVATFQLQVKLAKYGYNEAHADKYSVGFSVHEVKFFEVIENFPRILQSGLPNGVGDLKYSVVVSACIPFEVTTDILNHI